MDDATIQATLTKWKGIVTSGPFGAMTNDAEVITAALLTVAEIWSHSEWYLPPATTPPTKSTKSHS
jgi:hypothetical protein